jgi:hypothetical protein
MSLESIVQGVITYGGTPGSPVSFSGEGIAFIERPPLLANGAVLLTLDEGLIGNAGALPPGILSNSNARSVVTIRGTPITTITRTAVLYLTDVPDVGATQILVVTVDNTGLLADPDSAEIMVWRIF